MMTNWHSRYNECDSEARDERDRRGVERKNVKVN